MDDVEQSKVVDVEKKSRCRIEQLMQNRIVDVEQN